MKTYIEQFVSWLQGYLAVASTTAVTFIVAWAANQGVEIDAVWLQTVLVGLIGILVLLVERALVAIAEQVQALGWFKTLVKLIRLGQSLPSYEQMP